jgi:hypothetical protein
VKELGVFFGIPSDFFAERRCDDPPPKCPRPKAATPPLRPAAACVTSGDRAAMIEIRTARLFFTGLRKIGIGLLPRFSTW